MIKTFVYLLLSIFAITLVRVFIGILMKGLASYMGGGMGSAAGGPGTERGRTGASSTGASSKGGVLRKDSYSGIYITEESAVSRVIDGETHYFASEENLRSYLDRRSTQSSRS